MKKLFLSFCVIAVFLSLFGCTRSETPATTQEPTYSVRQWTPVYNAHECTMNVTWVDGPGKTTEELTEEQIKAVLPGSVPETVSIHGFADFKYQDTLRVRMWLEAENDQSVFVVIGEKAHNYGCCYYHDEQAATTACGDIVYRIYQKKDAIQGNVFADGMINDMPVHVYMDTDGAEADKAHFESVLEWLSWYGSDQPNLEVFHPKDP